MPLQLVTPPAVEPISIEAAKLHVKAEDVADDALIRAIVQTAREQAEQKTGRALIEQRWERTYDSLPCELELARPPLVTVESLKYLDTAGVQQTLSASLYTVDDAAEPGRIVRAYGASWPAERCDTNAVRARFVAGYACGFTAVAATDVCTHSGLRSLANNAVVRVSNSGGALPAPLQAGVDYFVVQAAGAAFKLSLTQAGAAIDLTDAGTGLHYLGEVPSAIRQWMLLQIGAMYENREAFVTGTIVSALSFVDRLLDRYTVPRI
jgi:uncharacterized phiE125 gp8 family phage protein